MKIIILTDLEGTAGVVDFRSQAFPDGKYYEEARLLLTEEINASCEGALEAGADEILVVDGHGVGGIVPAKIHKRAKLLHGRPVPKYWELDKKWDGLFLLAHHAFNGTDNGNLNHTYSSQNIISMQLNGKAVGEIGMNVYLAGWYGTPVLLVTGDEAACREAQRYVSGMEAAVVKWGINRTCAVSLSPEAAREKIRKASYNALKKADKTSPLKLEGPCELVTEYLSSADAFAAYQKPLVEKISPTATRIKGGNFLEMWDRFFYG